MTGLYVASNPTALSSQFNLARTMGELGGVLTRLSTGLRINSGKDDPAGLIASELLKSQITGTTTAIKNTQRANSLIATADSSMSQVGNLLNDIKGLVVEAANTGAMSAEQIAANQMQVNASIESIDRIARTTAYGGKKLLDGSMDFRTAGADNGNIGNLKITAANFGTASAIGVNVNVQQAASNATLFYKGTGVDQNTTLDITGNVGTKTLTFGAGTSNAEIANAINSASDSTGVGAYIDGLAERGNIILSSAGANNDIVITANKVGFDNGNYSFRITQGTTNDVRIVTEASNGVAGVVEISLAPSYGHTYNGFAGLFDVTVDTTDRVTGGASTATTAGTSVSMTRGTSNKVIYHDTDSAAVAQTNGRSIIAVDNASGRMSELNGWTVKVDDGVGASGLIDADTKTMYIRSQDVTNDSAATNGGATSLLSQLANQALAGTAVSGGAIPPNSFNGTPSFTFNLSAALQAGDSFTFAGGANAGEVEITYKEGATANDILKMLNNAPNVKATLKDGVDGTALIAALPSDKTFMSASGANAASKYTAGATAQDVINLINSKLGDRFNAASLKGDAAGGRVSFMDSAVDYGSVNLDNALRFTGMDDGPIVRLSTLGTNGLPVANQKLSIEILHPTEKDIAAGIHTPILKINLATDAAGNSITTAKDIADLFDRLTPEKTLGVSAEVLYPPGVDPNGRIFGVDACGNDYELENCPTPYGLGIVQPTEIPGLCGPENGDLVLLGSNQNIIADKAVARIAGVGAVPGAQAVSASGAASSNGTTAITTAATTSALNGLTFGFTLDETKEGFDEATGTLITWLDSTIVADASAASPANDSRAVDAVNGAIAANWEAIRAYTGATGDAVNISGGANFAVSGVNDAKAYDANSKDGLTAIAGNASASGGSTRGVNPADPALIITAKNAGTEMAGIKIHFIQNDSLGLTEWTSGGTQYTNQDGVPDLKVTLKTNTDGSRELLVYANISGASSIGSIDLAQALNSNADFSKLFTATAPIGLGDAGAADASGLGSILFNNDVTKPQGETVGGYRVNSPDAVGTSSGVSMTGQSDANERLILQALDTGSEAFVQVYVAQGSFATYDPYNNQTSYTNGTDVVATINGQKANARGNAISIDTPDLALSMTIGNAPGWSSFSINGGGALFQLGPDVVSNQQMRVGLQSMLATRLGGNSGNLYQLKNGGAADLTVSDQSRRLADKIINEAISSVATVRGRLGAIQRSTLEPNIAYLQDSLVALSEANQTITNADFAEESSNLTRLQLLMQAGSQALALAGQLPQYAAQLVG
ncbi:hypothetical protein FACS189443_1430 [Planctomycetales bacterium]|nr:hypothetical protein FACS189443_1430 [Planctomycetales bacterium]